VTSRRPPDFDLAAAIREPGFTPRAGDADALLALGGADAERALLKIAPAAAAVALRHLDDAGAPHRARAARLIARLALGEQALAPRLLALLDDRDPRVARAAAVGAGKLRHPDAEARLLAALERPETRRAVVEALGKAAGAAALDRLRALDPGEDAELRRLRAQAILRLDRTLAREAPSDIDLDASPPSAAPVLLRCRAGLEELLVDELGPQLAPRRAGRGRVEATLDAPLARLYRARLFIDAGFPLPPRRGEPVAAVVGALRAPDTLALLRALTRGPIRYRIAWTGGGHRRADVLAIATAVPELRNDPTATTWDVEVGPDARILLVPRRFEDPRWTYRRRDVPAASHPTIAAALARVGGARPDDIVWDPFCGSGTELCERALLGPYRALFGTDRDPAALAAAAENLAAAGHRATLEARRAEDGVPAGTTLILTNPPMGHRVRSGDVPALLVRIVELAAAALPRGGRLCWLSPDGERTARAAADAGMRVALRRPVDLGGLAAELQLLSR
jgi:predicted RNA methylase